MQSPIDGSKNDKALHAIAGQIAEYITDEDIKAAIADARRALGATITRRKVRTDEQVKKHENPYEKVPDETVRARAREFIISYAWGKPSQTNLNLNVNKNDGGPRLSAAEISRSLADNLDVSQLLGTMQARFEKEHTKIAEAELIEEKPGGDPDDDDDLPTVDI